MYVQITKKKFVIVSKVVCYQAGGKTQRGNLSPGPEGLYFDWRLVSHLTVTPPKGPSQVYRVGFQTVECL